MKYHFPVEMAKVVSNNETKNLPWIEKYRPQQLNEIIDHDTKKNTLKKMIELGEMPHLLFYGPPGCGKTTMALATARMMYGDYYRQYTLELNASDDRGIDTVRTKIPEFARAMSDKRRLIILDEADLMTGDAQGALRRVIEIHSKNCFFCLICNNVNAIIPGIQSRCTRMRFLTLNPASVSEKIIEIAEKESIKISESGVDALVQSQKDFRQIINTLQCMNALYSLTNTEIDKSVVYKYIGRPDDSELDEMFDVLSSKKFTVALEYLSTKMEDNVWSTYEVLMLLTDKVVKSDKMTDRKKASVIETFSKVENRITNGRDSYLQKSMIVSAFH